MTGEATKIRRRAVREDDVQVVVGVLGGHAVVGTRALEDEADDGGVGRGELDERVVGEGLLRGHA
ncbi:hypothetical protein GCM10022233_78020 [Streptomyces shaanxiensis]|uniref:Uncharacterized protein n=1 Tax=Streptomyces shaanxiensis TaxID=653357 RepID=A0ABP7W9X2_9ACTN